MATFTRPLHAAYSRILTLVPALCLLLASCVRKLPDAPPPVRYPDYHRQSLGASVRDLLSNEHFSSLTVEVQYMPGARPAAETLDSLQSFMEAYLNKPDGIVINLQEIKPSRKKILAKDSVLAIEDRERRHFPVNRNLVFYVMFTNGTHLDRNILGMAYRNTSVVLYGGAIAANSGERRILSRTELETSVLLHEVGHLLGLGNPKTTAFSRKKTKGKHGHCKNEMCLMYWSTETGNASLIRRKGRIPQLDKECLQDLQESGGRAAVVPLLEASSSFLSRPQ
jgi:predicted Zn-dependent protease with MMP-like domain